MDIKKGIKQLDIEEKANLLTGDGFWTTTACPKIGLDSAFLSDGPHGLRVQHGNPNHLGMGTSLPATCYPTASAMACSWNEELCQSLGVHLGEEAAFEGVSMVLGPGLNVKRSPLCGRNFEYFSEDSYLSGKIAAAYVRGIQQNGVTSCVKHFAVNSRELGRMVCNCVVDEKTLRETYLTGFEIAIKQGKACAVMTAYNKVNGVYCNQNSYLINGILRHEWKFDGLVISDWGGGRDAAMAVEAGADLEMPCCKFSPPQIVYAVKSGRLNEDKVDESVYRLYSFVDRAKTIEREPFDIEEHSLFARKCAEECLVLLKNDGVLPLKYDERVALIGDFAKTPRYQGAGSSLVNPTHLYNILGEMQKSCKNLVGFKRGFKRFGSTSRRLLNEALKLAEKSDTIVLCLGLDEDGESEGSDRETIDLTANQIELLKELKKLNKKIIVVLSCGSVVDMSWDNLADGILHAHLCGQSGAGAVVDALFGKVNPSGRLAETYPEKLSDVPCDKIYATDPYKMVFAEGIYVGYKYYQSQDIKVKYPFGYGLSYTQFEYTNFNCNQNGVSFTVKNIGERDGATVAQIYVQKPEDFVSNPKELKAFKKIYLKSGESKKIEIEFDEYAFRMWNIEKACWEVGGDYHISLGENSRDLLFEECIHVGEENYTLPEGYLFKEEMSCETFGAVRYKQYYAANLAAGDEDGKLKCYKKEQEEKSKRSGNSKQKHKRIVATYSTIIRDLWYAKGFMGKVFGFIAYHYSTATDKLIANSMSYLPLRSLMQFMGLNSVQAQGMVEACNGKFFTGLKKLIFKK